MTRRERARRRAVRRARDEAMAAARDAGVPWRQIARDFGVAPSTVQEGVAAHRALASVREKTNGHHLDRKDH